MTLKTTEKLYSGELPSNYTLDSNPNRLLLVSHQLPQVIHLDKSNSTWSFSPRQGHTALYSGINALQSIKNTNVLHIGWTGVCFDSAGNETDISGLDANLAQELNEELLAKGQLAVHLAHSAATGHYEGYCKSGKNIRNFN